MLQSTDINVTLDAMKNKRSLELDTLLYEGVI